MKLGIVIASTRPARAGLPVGRWFLEAAKSHGGFEIDFIDLKEVALPFLDEPKHPRLGQYVHDHTKAWSKRVTACDAFAIVSAEYNSGFPAPLKNALDFVSAEWAHKAVAFVTYGGVSGGTRAAQMTKQVVTTLRMVPIVEAVNIPFIGKHLDPAPSTTEEGTFNPPEETRKAVKPLLDELARMTRALAPLRSP